MGQTKAQIINHTHWDREWFLSSIYTSRWIPRLIAKLETLAAGNPRFRFLLDGQTLVVEDLLEVVPEYEPRIQDLVSSGCLQIGPYYCQPDWQLSGGELLVRNLIYGQKDVARYGGAMRTGWMVDTFGHISQAPQIHRLFEIEAVYVWRGVPDIVPYFTWIGADGTQLQTINLFGGYRNLYGVSLVPEVAIRRLAAEVEKLRAYYPTADIPLFDGYDLEDNPEDPVRFFEEIGSIPEEIRIQEATVSSFAEEIRAKDLSLPAIRGELNSGKYGATFTGVFSARTYLKIMANDCERMLFQMCEPLGAMAQLFGRQYAEERYEQWGRLLLQNGVHDCICGVSIDQVHEKMEYSYRKSFEAMTADAQESLEAILGAFEPGQYVVSTIPYAYEAWQLAGDELVLVKTEGAGVWPVSKRTALLRAQTPTDLFQWTNDYYEAAVQTDGVVTVGEAQLGEFVVAAERGDTYSEELGERLGRLRPTSPLLLEHSSEHHAQLQWKGEWQGEGAAVMASVRLFFDDSPLIKWQIDLESRGTDLRVEMVLRTATAGPIKGGMPFDTVERPLKDTDLLPRELPTELSRILLGQRELNVVSMFPFHDIVSAGEGEQAVAVLAKGVRGYRAEPEGTIILPLRRAVEWLTAADLEDRVGDAGPFFYVPDARCERLVRHEVAVAFGLGDAQSPALLAANAAYQHPALVVASEGKGKLKRWRLLQENLPMSALTVQDGTLLARFYNPTHNRQPLSKPYEATNVWGEPIGVAAEVGGKKILTIRVETSIREEAQAKETAPVRGLWPTWRVGDNQGHPDPGILAELAEKSARLEEEIAQLEAGIAGATERERLRQQHRIYMLRRESLEFRLSYLLGQRKLAQGNRLTEAYLYEPDPEIAELGLALNQMRIRRRVFDYVVEALKGQ